MADRIKPGTWKQLACRLYTPAGEALNATMERENLSRTETVNRALRVYDFLTRETANGGELVLRRADGTDAMLVQLF